MEQFFLAGEEHHHLFRVARVKAGDFIWLTDGQGHRLQAEVIKIEKDKTWLRPCLTIKENLKTNIILGLSLIKPAAFELVIQKATELGVTEIQPLIAARSQNFNRTKLEAKKGRWEKIVREALKQAKGAVLPVINFPVSLKAGLNNDPEALKFYLDEESEWRFRDILLKPAPEEVTLLVGPEGGWTTEEKEMLNKARYIGLNLGGRVLRAETAAISALALISHFWNW
ncbi:MAG: RsmE family RNA methyltransferase [Candidatus Saccharicenans sp.]|nr:16S rRNA (uracil(1498)-N(3))-methyltransferase [Candidatus Aminicenantes bacterium]